MALETSVASRQTQVGEQVAALQSAADALEKEIGMLEERLLPICTEAPKAEEAPPTPLVLVCGHASTLRAEVARFEVAWKRLGELRRRIEL